MNPHIPEHELSHLLLIDDGNDSVPQESYLKHLETCAECQSRLAILSGEGNWLGELKQVLNDNIAEHDAVGGPPSVAVMLDGSYAGGESIDASRIKKW